MPRACFGPGGRSVGALPSFIIWGCLIHAMAVAQHDPHKLTLLTRPKCYVSRLHLALWLILTHESVPRL